MNHLPKIRSDLIMAAASGRPCSLRIASFVGQPCSGIDTTVAAHVLPFAKGMATKPSDLGVAFACRVCHAIYDRADGGKARELIEREYPVAFLDRVLRAVAETQATLVSDGIIIVKDGVLI